MMNRGTPLLAAGALFVMTFGASCAHYSAALDRTDKVSPDRAYVYGRFHIDAPRSLLGMDGHQTMGFILRCDDRSEYRIRFSREQQVQVIPATPARCALVGMLFTDADGVVRGSKRVLGNPPGGFVLAAGTAYYLGDFLAESTFGSDWKVLYTEMHFHWNLTSADDNYEGTTAEMKRTFPSLAQLTTENRVLVTHRHVPGEPRKHAGRASSSSGPDDVVSPERAARLVEFTKRRYPTPAECEAACPGSGDCYPFRGDTGPAMTCVVRCKSDKDCPDGLACNCPNGDGTACGAIASTPEDRMAGFCLSIQPAGEQPARAPP